MHARRGESIASPIMRFARLVLRREEGQKWLFRTNEGIWKEENLHGAKEQPEEEEEEGKREDLEHSTRKGERGGRKGEEYSSGILQAGPRGGSGFAQTV